jgi:hypothetical protein
MGRGRLLSSICKTVDGLLQPTEIAYRDGGHEQLISNGGRFKPAFAERDKCKPVLLGLSLAGNLVKLLLSLYGTEWRERGYGLSSMYIVQYRGGSKRGDSITDGWIKPDFVKEIWVRLMNSSAT